MTHRADVAILGGGPAGAALAILLAERGCDVALFEQRDFPRFHIGESLVPAVNRTLARLGVLDRLDLLRFPRKHGVQFFNQSTPTRPFYFREATDPALHSTWQVVRGDFDAMLLQRAVEVGARVTTNARALPVAGDIGDTGAVRVAEPEGRERAVDARIFVDASGQHGVLARRLSGWRRMPDLHNAAVFAHYRDVDLDAGIDAGSTLVYRLDATAWLWLIPLRDVVSIGIVAPVARLHDLGVTPAAMLETAIAASPLLAARLHRARRVTPVRAARDFTYRAHRDGGHGWLLVGDALGFIDPIYSTGLFLALRSAELAAPAILAALASGQAQPDLAGFARDYDIAFDRFLTLVRAFYCDAFHFGAFAQQGEHRLGLVDMLTGDVSTSAAVDVVQAIGSDLAALGRQPAIRRGTPGADADPLATHQPRLHFAVDDVFAALVAASAEDQPLFAHPFFAELAALHAEFDIDIDLYLFLEATLAGRRRSLQDVATRLRPELARATWLRLGPHGLDYEHPPYQQTADAQRATFDATYREIDRFAGRERRSAIVRLHCFSESHGLADYWRANGVEALLLTDRPAVAYALPDAVRTELADCGVARHGGLALRRTHERIESLAAAPLSAAELWARLDRHVDRHGQLVLCTHETELLREPVREMSRRCLRYAAQRGLLARR